MYLFIFVYFPHLSLNCVLHAFANVHKHEHLFIKKIIKLTCFTSSFNEEKIGVQKHYVDRFVVLIVADDNCLVNSNSSFNCLGYINGI